MSHKIHDVGAAKQIGKYSDAILAMVAHLGHTGRGG
jgi:hypothetical protein